MNSKFVSDTVFDGVVYKQKPFPYTIIDNFLNEENLPMILNEINNLDNKDANSQFTDHRSIYEFNKYAFSVNYGDYLKSLFAELNSDAFIDKLETLTGIYGLVRNDITLQGAGIHRIENFGHLQLHTDFNIYEHNGVKLDRRINLLIYMNPYWKDEFNGHLMLFNKANMQCFEKIEPIINRCVIFNTSNKSLHGHPMPLNVPEHIRRQSISVYYYTKNMNGVTDFEGDTKHNTKWYSSAIP
jgi:Rps23 Pro-64 3,4-dihydroxylase Tpa1-like proline 4-hydroxylase